MTRDTRRRFLQKSGAAGLTIVAASAARTYAANEAISVGLIACGIRGMSSVGSLPNVRAVCDPDRKRAAEATVKFQVDEKNTGTDLRRILEDKSIDAVFIATCTQRTLHFDPQTEQIIGDEQASALLSRKYRKGGHWAIPQGV